MADELIFRLTVDDAGSATLGAFERKLRGLESEAKTLSGSMKTAFGNVSGYIVNFAGDAAREFAKFSKESVDAFLKFETAMVAVAKTTGIPKEQLGKFSEQIRETAVNLKGLGKDAAVQIASIAEVAGQLGISADKLAKGDFDAASKEILGFSTVIAKAKIALPEFKGGVEEIATVIAKQIQLYGETPAAAEQYLSVMNKLSDTTAATAKDIAGFLKNFTMAPTLKIMQEESAAWGATFVSLGQNAYDAATRMQSSFSQVLAGSKDTNVALDNLFLGNKKMADQLLDLTGKVREFSENGKQDITSYANLAREAIGINANEAMKIFVTTLSEVESSSERAAIATDMFGRVGAKAILTLVPELPKLSDAAKEAATVFLSTNEQALDSLAKMSGVSRKQFSDNADFMKAVYAKDMPDAIRVLVEEINKIDDESEKARVASEVFGEDWQVAMNKAEGGVKLFDEALQTAQKEIEATKNGASSIEQEYKTALDKVGTSFSELTAIMDDIKLQWGAPLADALSAGIKLMIPVIDELRKNFMGVVEEFGRELGGESLASAFRQTAEAFKGTIEEMGANADTFIAALKEQFTLPNLFATAMQQWSAFAVWLGDSAAALAKSVASSLSGIGSGFTNEEYKAEMEDVFSPDQYLQTADAIKEVSAAAEELNVVYGNTEPPTTQEDLDALIQLKNANIELLQSNTDLRAEYQGVARDLSAAIESGQAPTAELTARMESLRQKIADVGVEAYGNSTFPDMTAAMMTSQAQSQALTAEMAAMQAQIKGLGAEYEATDKQIQEKQKANDELQKNMQRTADLVAKQKQEEMKAANDLYREQQKQAADSIKWIGEIDEASKKRLFAEQDAVKVLQEQGVELTDLQAQEVRRMQAAYQTDAAYQKQTADLEKQLAPMASLTEISTKIGEGFGKLGDNIGSLGDLFEFDTSGITSVLDKIQGFSELPKIFGEMKANITGIFDSLKGFDLGEMKANITGIFDSLKGFDLGEMKANITGIFDSLKGFDLGSIFSGGGLSGMLSGILSGLSSIAPIAGIVAAAWEPIKDLFGSLGSLFKNTKSEGTEAAEKFQDFVRSTVTGGAELAAAMDEAFHSMDFHDQFADMTDYTYQLWGAFANTPIDGVNTGLQLLYETMEAAGVPTKKLGQVAIQTFVGMQNAGYSAAEMSAKFAEMLNLTTEQAELLVQTLTGIAPPDITVNANVNLNKEAVQQSLKDIQATLEASSEYLTLHPEIKFQEFEASGLQNLSAQFEQLRAEGALTEDQFASFNNLLTAIGSDGRVTAEEINTLTTSISNIKNGTEVTTAVVQEGMNGLMSIVLDATTYMQETGATMLDFVDEAGFQGLTEQMYALGAQGILSAQQIATIEPVLQAIGTDGVVTADEIEQLRASLTAVEGQMAGAGEEGQVTSNIFDANSASARNLTDQVKTLESRLGTMTDQLTGTGTAGATTSDIFATAQMSASGLDMTTKGLSGDLVNLTGQLSGAGAETLATSNLFTMAGGSAEGLQGDVNNLDSQVATANASLAATQKALADIPNEKTVTFRVVTVGSVPKMATGGTVGAMGMAIVNERGSEIAHFPGGGMALMTAPGPTLGAFPTGTEIIPHSRSMEILSQFPGIPRMATGGTVGAMVAPVINITITGNTIANNVDIKNIAKQVSAEISRNYNARR